MPIGYLIGTSLVAAAVLSALRPVRRPQWLSSLSYFVGLAWNELPFAGLLLLAASTALTLADHEISSPAGMSVLGVALALAAGLAVVGLRATRTRAALANALERELGVALPPVRLPWARILAAPWLMWRRDVERVAGIPYGDAPHGRNLLDVYRPRHRRPDGPTLVYFHGGRFRSGHKRREGRVLLHHLASHGWVCISANYRLKPQARFPEHHVDAKKAIAWVREQGGDYGADVSRVFVAGSSAGAHMAALAALTPDDRRFQPGFEHVGTRVAAAICLYGYYGPLDSGTPGSSPSDYPAVNAPPFFIAHGDLDVVVRERSARWFAEQLRAASSHPVVYAELPGAHHSFDRFHSIRNDTVVIAVEAFAAWVAGDAGRSATPLAETRAPR
jgi:acetyl esterase/lipase